MYKFQSDIVAHRQEEYLARAISPFGSLSDGAPYWGRSGPKHDLLDALRRENHDEALAAGQRLVKAASVLFLQMD